MICINELGQWQLLFIIDIPLIDGVVLRMRDEWRSPDSGHRLQYLLIDLMLDARDV